MREVVIVGAGFAGSYLAWRLAERGIDVLVFEEHPRIGEPPHCAGVLGLDGLARIGLLSLVRARGLILTEIRGMRLVSYRRVRTVLAERPFAAIVDRPGLDKLVASLAADRGAEIMTSTKVTQVSLDGRARTTRGEFKARIVVCAEGARAALLRMLGMRQPAVVPAAQVDVKTSRAIDSDVVEVVMLTRDFFGWVVPLGEREARVGLASRTVKPLLSLVRRIAKWRLGDVEVRRVFGGLVVVSGPRRRFSLGRVTCIGDCAGQTKPTTGGGVFLSGLSGLILSRVVESVLSGRGRLDDYDRLWWRLMSGHISYMRALRRVMSIFGLNTVGLLLTLLPSEVLELLLPVSRESFDLQAYSVVKALSRVLRPRLSG